MFGHQRGAFSGAVADRNGFSRPPSTAHCCWTMSTTFRFPCSPNARCDPARDRAASGVGPRDQVDIRIIAACNQPLEPMVREGRFRQTCSIGSS